MKQHHFIVLYFSIFLLTACVKTAFLNNGHTRVATNHKVYKNKMYFDNSLLAQIDTTAIYEEIKIKGYGDPNTTYGVYRFYGNGNYSKFHLDRNAKLLTPEMFDPTYTGWRGVLYKKHNKIYGDLITQTGEMRWAISKETQEFTINEDTLIVEVKDLRINAYVKRHVYNYLLNHNADW